MRSKAHFRGHPIHPALIPFPLAFLCGAFGFDVAGVLAADPELSRTATRLAALGVATALIAAIPGLIDYLNVVPPKSTGKRRATKHMIVNLSAVVLFVVGLMLRRGGEYTVNLPILLIELLAVCLLTAGGWMGGVLVSRNQISVDHRYAGAGKWSETTVPELGRQGMRVAGPNDLAVNQMKLIHTPNGRVVLARSESGWLAFADHCSHRGGSLADGVMICGTVQCPWHGSQFDAATGGVKAGPAKEPIATYTVEQRADGIYLRQGSNG